MRENVVWLIFLSHREEKWIYVKQILWNAFLEKGLGNVILNVSIIVTAVHSHGDKQGYVALEGNSMK